MMKLDWKIYAAIIGLLLLGGMIFFLKKFFFFLIIISATAGLAAILKFIHPLKYTGLELVTLSTILVGIIYGPVVGGVYGFTMLLVHLILGDYYIGAYLMWLLPEYVLLGVLSGILRTGIIGFTGVSFIVGLNLLNLFFTFIGENERFAKELPFAIGNIIINSFIVLQVLGHIVNFIG